MRDERHPREPLAVAAAWLRAFQRRDADGLLGLTSADLEFERWVGVEHGHDVIRGLLQRQSYGVTMDPTPLRTFARGSAPISMPGSRLAALGAAAWGPGPLVHPEPMRSVAGARRSCGRTLVPWLSR